MDCGFNNNGGIFVANNKERFDEYRRLKTVCGEGVHLDAVNLIKIDGIDFCLKQIITFSDA